MMDESREYKLDGCSSDDRGVQTRSARMTSLTGIKLSSSITVLINMVTHKVLTILN
jgi:hypothetical protein